jgi:hypothetical protein
VTAWQVLNWGLYRVLLGQLVVKNQVEQRSMHPDSPVVFDQAQLAKAIHEEADARSGRTDHVRKGFLA